MIDDSNIIVTVHDCRKLGFCMKQVRPWFGQQGLDFRDFIRNGIPAHKLRATQNEYVEDVIRQAKKRIEG